MVSPAPYKPATILSRGGVSPPPSSPSIHTLPLTFYDLGWIHFHPIQRLLFYRFPCSKSQFLQSILPNLKNSLAQTLTHFLPMAGNLIYPLGTSNSNSMPEFRYEEGDSVSFTVAEANAASDFDFLTGNSPRNAAEFYSFFSDLHGGKDETGSIWKSPLLSVQVTFFPGSGFCIGFNTDHSIGDASTIVGFIKAWSLISKNEDLASRNLAPFYDRSVIKDPLGLKNIFWDQVKNVKIGSSVHKLPEGKVRATFILQKEEIQKMKASVKEEKPELVHLSSFTVTSAYVWSCLAKSAAEIGEPVKWEDAEYFAFAADARRRLDPPLPATYFGNCVMMLAAEMTHGVLRGEKGCVTAAERIGSVIGNEANKKEVFGKDADKAVAKFGSLIGRRLFGVAGSPKFDLYDADFGWGNPVKYEAVAIDGDGSMSLSKSREFAGGLEIGISLPEKKMAAFAEIFRAGLEEL